MKRLLILTLGFVLAACADNANETTESPAEENTPVTVTKPELREVNVVLKALGTVESIQSPTIAAETDGRIVKLIASEGEAISAGQVMAAIDDTIYQIESAKTEAEVKRQQAMVDNQSREVSRLNRLAKTQAVSQDQLENEEAQFLVLQGQLEVARKQWEQAKYLESRTRVTAPMNGIVTRRHVSIGDYVTIGQPLFELVAIDTLRARLSFPEQDAAAVRIGKEVLLTSPAAPESQASGAVTSINPQIDVSNRALEVIVEFTNPGGWLPGSSVDAVLMVKTHPQALTVPRQSITNRNGHHVVYVIEEDRASERRVELGWQETNWTEVISGITQEDLVVVEGTALISNGSRVTTKAPQL